MRELSAATTWSGKNGAVYANGVRNAVGMDFHPETGELWFTDNGRDWLGDDLPGDELNRAAKPGAHFGFPYCHQGDFSDPEFGSEKSCDEFEPPVLLTGAHVANLGMAFTPARNALPARYQNGVFIALHGSWNRSVKTGYAVHYARTTDGGAEDYQPLRNRLAGGRQGVRFRTPGGRRIRRGRRAAGFRRLCRSDLAVCPNFRNGERRISRSAGRGLGEIPAESAIIRPLP